MAADVPTRSAHASDRHAEVQRRPLQFIRGRVPLLIEAGLPEDYLYGFQTLVGRGTCKRRVTKQREMKKYK